MLGGALLAGAVFWAGMAAAADFAPITQRLFDAVWADDMTKVKSSVSAGADLAAINDLGVRPVDMAIDKGHYDIAHYLLSVEKLRRDAVEARREPTPRERVVARTVEPAPLAAASVPSPSPSGWLTGNSGSLGPRIAPQPASGPVPGPARAVVPAPVPAPVPAAVPAPAPATPVQTASSAASVPRVQEKLWSPEAETQATKVPALKVVSVAQPRAIADTAPAAAVADPPVPQSQPADLGGSQSGPTAWLDKVTSIFSSAPEPPAAKPMAVPAQSAAEVPTPRPAPVAETAVPKPAPEPVPAAPAAVTETTAPKPPTPDLIDRVTSLFEPSTSEGAATETVETAKALPLPPAPVAAPEPVAETPAPAAPAEPTDLLETLGNLFKSSPPEVATTEAGQAPADGASDAAPSAPSDARPETSLAPDVSVEAPPAPPTPVAAPKPIAEAPVAPAPAEPADLLETLGNLFKSSPPEEATRTEVTATEPVQAADDAASDIRSVTEVPVQAPPAPPSAIAAPEPIAEAPAAAAPVPQPQPQPVAELPATAEPVSSTEGSGDLFKSLGDLFKSSSPEPTETPEVEKIETEQASTGVTPEVRPAAPEVQIQAASVPPVEITPPAVTAVAQAPDTEADTEIAMEPEIEPGEPGLFDQLADIFRPTALETAVVSKAGPIDAETPDEAPVSRPPEPAAIIVSDEALSETQEPTAVEIAQEPVVSEPPQKSAALAANADAADNDEPSLFSRLADVFQPAETVPEVVPSAAEDAPEVAAVDTPPIVPEPVPSVAETPPEVSTPAVTETEVASADEPGLFERLGNLFGGGDTAKPVSDDAVKSELQDAPVALPRGAVRKVAAPKVEAPEADPAPAEIVRAPVEPATSPVSQTITPTPAPQTPQAAAPAPNAVAIPDTKPLLPRPSAPVGTPAKVPTEVASVPTGPGSDGARKVLSPDNLPVAGNAVTAPAPMNAAPPLQGVKLRLGQSAELGTRVPAGKRGQCIDKGRWNTIYCIEDLTWPDAVAPAFQVTTNFYRGKRAIVEYLAGEAVQMHVMFPVKELRRVTEYFKTRYGAPTEVPDIWTALIGQPKRSNRTVRWRSRDAKSGAETVLEIREIDDLRWSSPPDVNHGLVRLFAKGRGSVFELLSSTDLLLVQLRRR